jgi:ABC-type uncharacterized transport system permease subunit
MFALGGGHYRPSKFNFISIALGFALQWAFLAHRGKEMGRCPLGSLFEVFIFLSWSMVLLYFLIGSAYRLSLLGAFTSPVVLLFQLTALLALSDTPSKPAKHLDFWLQLHASISIVAYGAFAMAGVAGIMYLAQERQLKKHKIGTFFFNLPPISYLAIAMDRLLMTGLILLTVGIFAGILAGKPATSMKVGWAWGVWVLYGALFYVERFRHMSRKRLALLSIVAFAVTLTTLWGITFISDAHL